MGGDIWQRFGRTLNSTFIVHKPEGKYIAKKLVRDYQYPHEVMRQELNKLFGLHNWDIKLEYKDNYPHMLIPMLPKEYKTLHAAPYYNNPFYNEKNNTRLAKHLILDHLTDVDDRNNEGNYAYHTKTGHIIPLDHEFALLPAKKEFEPHLHPIYEAARTRNASWKLDPSIIETVKNNKQNIINTINKAQPGQRKYLAKVLGKMNRLIDANPQTHGELARHLENEHILAKAKNEKVHK